MSNPPTPPLHDVTHVTALANYRLQLTFANDEIRIYDALQLMARPGVFVQLRDPALYRQAYVANGSVAWPGGIDVEPEGLYAHSTFMRRIVRAEVLVPPELCADPWLVRIRSARAIGEINEAIQQIAEHTESNITEILRLRGEPILPPGVACLDAHRDYATARAQLTAAEAVLREHGIPTPQEEAAAFWRASDKARNTLAAHLDHNE